MTFRKILIFIYLLIIALVLFLIAQKIFIHKYESPIEESKDFNEQNSINKNQQIKLANVVLNVNVANTEKAREQGLSGRAYLTPDTGMLFIFDVPDKYAFWMKDMNFPIDIIWLDENLKVVDIQKNADPSSYPKTFKPRENVKYVLEVVSGFSEKNNLKIGDVLQFLQL